jgi:hypothetical protein
MPIRPSVEIQKTHVHDEAEKIGQTNVSLFCSAGDDETVFVAQVRQRPNAA